MRCILKSSYQLKVLKTDETSNISLKSSSGEHPLNTIIVTTKTHLKDISSAPNTAVKLMLIDTRWPYISWNLHRTVGQRWHMHHTTTLCWSQKHHLYHTKKFSAQVSISVPYQIWHATDSLWYKQTSSFMQHTLSFYPTSIT